MIKLTNDIYDEVKSEEIAGQQKGNKSRAE